MNEFLGNSQNPPERVVTDVLAPTLGRVKVTGGVKGNLELVPPVAVAEDEKVDPNEVLLAKFCPNALLCCCNWRGGCDLLELLDWMEAAENGMELL
ncbi:hypothetical protein WR25_22689 [Diploscapter pachys]|uniref:Uncharacterized protein n=1 Tax=Diploscapter pachys TaxID=2018661 RepID=A0A2A2M0K5_9BILA|nr:hypothetical protein WR25_22689 [Diploscapter pachys]